MPTNIGIGNGESNSERSGELVFEPIKDPDSDFEVSFSDDRNSAEQFQLELLIVKTDRRDNHVLAVRLKNNSTEEIRLPVSGNEYGDSMVSFLVLDDNGIVRHKLENACIYSRETVGNINLASGGEAMLFPVAGSGDRNNLSSLASSDFDQPIEVFVVARLEKNSSKISLGQIGPIYSPPKKVRITKLRDKPN